MGAPVRGFDAYSYGQKQFEGESYSHDGPNGDAGPDPLVGPIPPSDGVTFRYLDARAM